MKTAELSGAMLDFYVAKHDPRCEGLTFEDRGDHIVGLADIEGEKLVCMFIHKGNLVDKFRMRKKYQTDWYAPSTDWVIGGSIIERESIDLMHIRKPEVSDGEAFWSADMWSKEPDRKDPETGEMTCSRISAYGPTPLIAAMRCYVTSKFGPEVPDEIKDGSKK
jgi:hypothetical protein